MKKQKAIKFNTWVSFEYELPQKGRPTIGITEADKDGNRYIYEIWFNKYGQLCSSYQFATGDFLTHTDFTHWCYINAPSFYEV